MRGQVESTLEKPFTWKQEKQEVCVPRRDETGFKAQRAGQRPTKENRVSQGKHLTGAPKTMGFQSPGWEGRSCEDMEKGPAGMLWKQRKTFQGRGSKWLC